MQRQNSLRRKQFCRILGLERAKFNFNILISRKIQQHIGRTQWMNMCCMRENRPRQGRWKSKIHKSYGKGKHELVFQILDTKQRRATLRA